MKTASMFPGKSHIAISNMCNPSSTAIPNDQGYIFFEGFNMPLVTKEEFTAFDDQFQDKKRKDSFVSSCTV